MAAMAAILDFPSEQFYLFLSTSHPRGFLPSFMPTGLSYQEKKWKIDFQDGGHSGPLGFRTGTILAILLFKTLRCFLSNFKSIGLLVQEKKRKICFQDGRRGGHLGFPIGTILTTFDLQVTPILPTKFQVNWPLGSGEEAKNRFSR